MLSDEKQKIIDRLNVYYKKAGDACLSTYRNNTYPPLAALNSQDADIRHGATLIMYNLVVHEGKYILPNYALKVLQNALDKETDGAGRVSLTLLIKTINRE